MTEMKIGTFPGRLENYAVEDNTTVRQALEMVGITVGEEQEVKLDGEAVSLDAVVNGGRMLLVTKRLKGAK